MSTDKEPTAIPPPARRRRRKPVETPAEDPVEAEQPADVVVHPELEAFYLAVQEKNASSITEELKRLSKLKDLPPPSELKIAMEAAIAAKVWTTGHSTLYTSFACGANGGASGSFDIVVAGDGDSFPSTIKMRNLMPNEEWRLTFKDTDIARFCKILRDGTSSSPCIRFDRVEGTVPEITDDMEDEDLPIATLNASTGHLSRIYVDAKSNFCQDNAVMTVYWQGRTDKVFVMMENVIDPSLDALIKLMNIEQGWTLSISSLRDGIHARLTSASQQYCSIPLTMKMAEYTPVELDERTKYYRYRLSMKVAWLSSALKTLKMAKTSFMLWVVEELPGDSKFPKALMRVTLISQESPYDYIDHREIVETMERNNHMVSDIIAIDSTEEVEPDSDDVQCDVKAQIGGMQDDAYMTRWDDNADKIVLTVNDTFSIDIVADFVKEAGNGVILVRTGVGTLTPNAEGTSAPPVHMQLSMNITMFRSSITRTILCTEPIQDEG